MGGRTLTMLLACLFNESFVNGVFLDTLLIATVKPLHKKGVTTDCTSYRSILYYQYWEKLLKKIMNGQIVIFWKIKTYCMINNIALEKIEGTLSPF